MYFYERLLHIIFALKCLHSGTIPGRGRGHAPVQGHAGEVAGHDHVQGQGRAPAGGTLDQGECYRPSIFLSRDCIFKIQGILILSELGT